MEDLQLQLEALNLEHSECSKTQKAIENKFEDACVEVATLTQQLKDVRSKLDDSTLEIGRLRAQVQ